MALNAVQSFHQYDRENSHHEFVMTQSYIKLVSIVVVMKDLTEGALGKMSEDVPCVINAFSTKENPGNADQGKGDGYLHTFVECPMPVELSEVADSLPQGLRPVGTYQVEAV